MANKFDYQNMLNKISRSKMTKNKNPEFSKHDRDVWNNAIDLCYRIVELREDKFEPTTEQSKVVEMSTEEMICIRSNKMYWNYSIQENTISLTDAAILMEQYKNQ